MAIRFVFLGAVVAASAAWVLGGCSGRTESSMMIGAPGPDGQACVDISTSSYDTSCSTASDCISITAGRLCPESCACGGATINVSGQAAYDEATAGLANGGCPCPSGPVPQCIAGTCTLCTGEPGDPSGCDVDAGPPPIDSGFPHPDVSDVACAEIVVTPAERVCTTAADCTFGPSGQICPGACACWGTPMNVAAAAQLDQEASGFATGDCPCIAPMVQPQCVGGTCMACTPLPDGGFTGCSGG
jgi:hypothetical protein